MEEKPTRKKNSKGKKWAPVTLTLLLILSLFVTLSSVVYYTVLVFSVDNLSGSTTVNGQYHDARGRKVQGATVRVEGTDIINFTDENGRYVLHDVPAGEQTIVFERGGYPTISVTQLIIPEEMIPSDRFPESIIMKERELDIPDNIVGGVLVSEPDHHVRIREDLLAPANLSGRLFINSVSLKNTTVSVYNSTINATVNETGHFDLLKLFPGILLLNVTGPNGTLHALSFLEEGDNDISYNLDGNGSHFKMTAVGGNHLNGSIPMEKPITINARDMEGGNMNELSVFRHPLSYNPLNLTIVDEICPSAMTKRMFSLNSGMDLPTIHGHIYNVEITKPGFESLYIVNLTYNGTDTLDIYFPQGIPPVSYEYTLAGFWVIIVFLLVTTIFIAYGIKSAYKADRFGRVMTGSIATFVSSASLPLAFIMLPVAHNWLLGGALLILLLARRKDFSN